MPNDSINKRAEVGQRDKYLTEDGLLPEHIEFELSRLFEKEIHYHIKLEIEKKLLEQQPDFNTVAVFSVIDVKNFGYLDFHNLKAFLKKFNKDISKPEINAIIRR